jgi:sugar-specific transcriptional regulator TrmB
MSKETPENVKESLRSIGLTDYEIAIYLTLISKGPMDARELSEASSVPYSRIYNILTQLEKDKMWILKEEESRPSRYFAKSPDEALVIAKKQYSDSFDGYSDTIIRALTPIYESHDTPIKVALYIHRGRDVCINRALSLINTAKMALYFVTQDYEFLDVFYEEIKKARARIAEIRSRDQVFGTSLVMDEGEDAFIILTQDIFKKLSYFGVMTDHIAFGPASNYYFMYLYNTADIVKLK